mgnify:FL=1
MHETIPWYAAGYDDSDWTPTDLFAFGWATNGLNTINGSHWFRKDFQVSGQQAGEKATLRLGCIVDADSVYVMVRLWELFLINIHHVSIPFLPDC